MLLLMFKDWGLMVPGAFPCGIKVVQRIKSGADIFGGVPAYLVYKFVLVIFNR